MKEEIRLLTEMLRLMRLEKYGAKSEKLSDAQLELLEPGVKMAEVDLEAEIPPAGRLVKVRKHAGAMRRPGPWSAGENS